MVLGPGYEDLLLCPPLYCVAGKKMPPGWAGPASAQNECASFTGHTMPVTSWGFKSDARSGDSGMSALIEHLHNGMSPTTCGQLEEAFVSQPFWRSPAAAFLPFVNS